MRTLKLFFGGVVTILLLGAFAWIFLPGNIKAQVFESLQFSAAVSNARALKAFKDQDLSRAASDLSAGLASSPDEGRLHFNLGLAMQLMKKGEDAEKSYKQVLKNPRVTDEQKFMVEYNLGRAMQDAKEIDKALGHYQAALDLNPESRETKINIELLLANGGGGGGKGDDKNKDKPKEGEGEGDKPDQPKEYQPNKAPQKPQFKSEDLSQSDVNKILGELKQQEQRIRGEYNRKDAKEPARGKDW